MDDDQQFCLRWNNHQSTLISVFDTLLENETLVDCTLAAEGKFLKAHKVVLSACSPYFATLLQEQYDKHPIFILKDVKYQELRAMMDYMYRGEVNISQDQLAALLKAAESLQIKGLSDNRSGAPKPEHHRGLNVPGSSGSGKLSAGYTLEQTQSKRARIGPSSMESQDMSGSREGSSSPSRRRRKVRRRSIENAMAADVHDNSNSSQIQTNQSSLLQQQQQQSNVSLAGVGAITAAASALASQLPVSAATLPTGSSSVAAAAAAAALASTQGTTTSVTKKTESVKGTSDAMNTENVQSGGGAIGADDQSMEHVKGDKQNHKQKSSTSAVGAAGKEQAELVIEPKSEYDEEGNEETVEDLTLDDEEMGMEDLDQNAGTSQGGEGSSQGYAPWQHDRSQDELLLATQEAQQRDPQDGTQQSARAIAGKSKRMSTRSSAPKDSSHVTTAQDSQAQSQNESRIRVRNWLMLADQSILEKSQAQTQPDKPLTTTNVATNTIVSTIASTSTQIATSAADVGTSTVSQDQNTQTMTRIGSIGRTMITCITPAGSGVAGLNNGSVGVMSAAALAAAGVELESVDESMTEVIVKIENTSASGDDEEEEREALAEGMAEGEVERVAIADSAAGEQERHVEDGEENEFNYDLKLSSPISWAFDTVKIENEEEFEDILSGEQDTTTNTEDDDDLLTTAAATTKQAAAAGTCESSDMPATSSSTALDSNSAAPQQIVLTRSSGVLKTRHSVKKRMLASKDQQQQQEKQLLEQQRLLQHLQLQPSQPAMQIKLPQIPATITSIAPKPLNAAASSAAAANESNLANAKNADFQSSLSDDKRYRILIQNQRMRKESLEHSEDMIYNADIEKPWVCRNCNRNYKWKNSLKCHLKNECGQPPRYFCSKLCGYATNVHSNLKRHLNTKCRDRMDEEQKNNSSTYTLVFQKND